MNEDFSLGKMSADARLTATSNTMKNRTEWRNHNHCLSGRGRCSKTQPWIRLGRK